MLGLPWLGGVAGWAVLALAIGAAGGWTAHGWKTEAEQAETERAAHREREQLRQIADQEAVAHERTRLDLQRALRAARPAVGAALARPACPASEPAAPPLAVGDVVVPGDALLGVRAAAGGDDSAPAAGQPGAAVRAGPADPGR